MPNKTTVLVTGAGGPAGMGTIRSLLRIRDIRVVAADMNSLAPGLYWAHEKIVLPSANDRGFLLALLNACTRFKVDVLFPTVDEEIAILAKNQQRLRGKVRFLIGNKDSIEACNDKLRTYIWLKKAEIPVVETRQLSDEASLYDAADEIGFPVVLKPRASRGGRGLYICRNRQQLLAAFNKLKACLPFSDAYVGVKEATDIILQEFLPGTEYDTIVQLGRDWKPLACVPMRADTWNVQEHRRKIVTERVQEVEDLSIRTVQCLRLSSPVDVELAKDKDNLYKILDVNPRVGGDVDLSTAAGCNIPHMYVRLAMGQKTKQRGFKEGVILVRYVGIEVIQPENIPKRGRSK